MPDSDSKNEPTFVVSDRRHFTSEGERRPDVPDAPESSGAHEPTASSLLVGEAPKPSPGQGGGKVGGKSQGATASAAGQAAGPGGAKKEAIPFPPAAPGAGASSTSAAAPSAAADAAPEPPSAEDWGPAGEEGEAAGPESVFSGFLESLYVSGMMQLGATMPGQIAQPQLDLEGARQTIEVLEALRLKTQGNLTPREARALEEILYELRMVFVQLTRKRAR